MVEIVEKEQFSVFGKGIAHEALKWIVPLWQEANNNFIEISNLAIHHHMHKRLPFVSLRSRCVHDRIDEPPGTAISVIEARAVR